jgi:hypothetical protein
LEWRTSDGEEVGGLVREVELGAVLTARPWRTFRWFKGQRHYSGIWWSATESDHVIYESRLELARLLFADFDPTVRRIIAQPFLLVADIDGRRRRHIPDYLLLTEDGPVVVDVKPRRRLDSPIVASTFAWTRRVLEARSWAYEVWTEPDPVVLENVRFLAGYRRPWLFDPDVLDRARSAMREGGSLGEAIRAVDDVPAEIAKPAVLYLLWRQEFVIEMRRPLSSACVVRRPR